MRLMDRPAHACCTTFKVATLTREDILADRERYPEPVVDGWAPSIAWAPHIGAYSLNGTIIRFCPWCGEALPDESEAALAEGQKVGTWIDVNASGEVTVTIAGEAVDATEFLAKLAPSNED